jgi:RimJ/RimL family protein N-acetyltransferase
MPTHIETARLVLSPEEARDAEWMAELFSARGTNVSASEASRRISEMRRTTETLGIGALVLRVKPDEEPIGYCALIVGRANVEEPELAYELLQRAHGNGYATEAARAMLRAAFDTGRQRVWSTVRAWNTPSLRVLDKLGFEVDHTTTDGDGQLIWLRCDGTPVNRTSEVAT